jgi:DNA-binding PadR family transcriptional regulator
MVRNRFVSDQDSQDLLADVQVNEPDLGWSIPFNISLDKLDLIVKACYTASADKHPVAASQISSISGIHPRTVFPNLRFLASIGLLVPDSAKKTYSLSSKGVEYAKDLSNKELDQAGKVLKTILPNTHLKELLGYIEVHGSSNLTADALFRRIKTFARLKDDSRYGSGVSAPYQTGITCLIDLLKRAGFVSTGASAKFDNSKTSTNPKKPLARVKDTMMLPSPNSEATGQTTSIVTQPINFNINIEVKDADSLKRIIELLKELKQL